MADQDRYERRRQEHSSAYPYDDGWAVWDLMERRQVGYFANLERAKADVKERNKSAACGERGRTVVSGQPAVVSAKTAKPQVARIPAGLFGETNGR